MKNICDTEIKEKIEKALSKIRPYLQADGGDIVLEEVTAKMVVKVRLTGSCESCDVSMMTLKNGVETTIKRAVPEVKKVVDITSS